MKQEIHLYLRAHIAVALLLAVACWLSGCTTAIRPRIDNPTPIEVRVPVPVPCVARAQIPALPPILPAPLTGNAEADTSILARSLLAHRTAADRAIALLSGCVAP